MGRNLGPLNIKDSYEGLVQISGSSRDTLTDGSGSLISSLNVNATTATSASHATTATSASHAIIADSALTATSASHAVNADSAVSSSYALTASFAENVSTPNLQEVTAVGNTSTNGIVLEDITGTGNDTLVVKGNFGDAFGKVYQSSGATVIEASGSSANDVIISVNGTTVVDIDETLINFEANVDALGQSIQAASFTGSLKGNVDGEASDSDKSNIYGDNTDAERKLIFVNDNPTTGGSQAEQLRGDTGKSITYNPLQERLTVPNIAATDINTINITASFASFQSASIGFLESITGSAKIIGDAFIILNNNTPTERYAGLVVQDSGSANNTSSFQYDGSTDDWFFEKDVLGSTEYGIALFGPEYTTKGIPTYNTNNTIPKGTGGHHLNDSSIVDDGSTITLGNKLDGLTVSGSVEITGSTTVIGTFAAGGADHTTTGVNAASVGGDQISATAERAAGVGGFQNTVSGTDAVVLGGFGQTASGLRSIVAGGIAGNATNIYSAILGGSSNSAEGVRATILGGDQGFVDSSTNDGVIIGSYQSNIENQAHNSTIINGFQSNINGYSGSAIIGGTGIDADAHHTVYVPNLHLTGSTGGTLTFSDGTTQTTAGGAAFPYTGSAQITGSLGVTGSISQEGSNSIVAGATPRVVILASSGSSLTTTQPDNMAIIASKACSINSTNTNTSAGGIFGAQSATFGTGETRASVILGGSGNTMNAKLSAIVAAENCTVSSYSNFVGGGFNIQVNGDKSAVLAGIGGRVNGGTNNTVLAGNGNQVNGSQNSIVAGSNNTIPSGVSNSAVIAGTSNDADHDRSVVIGGNALATTKADEVVVPSLDVNGTVVQNVQALTITSNTASLDASTGQMFTLGLQNAADTHLELSNQVVGQTFSLKITNNATSAGTITFDNQFDFEGGTAFEATAATSAVDILTFTTFDGTSVQCVGSKNFS